MNLIPIATLTGMVVGASIASFAFRRGMKMAMEEFMAKRRHIDKFSALRLENASAKCYTLMRQYGPDVTLDNALQGIRSGVSEAERQKAYNQLINELNWNLPKK